MIIFVAENINIMKIFAETERLVLREIVATDAEAMFVLDSNPEVHKYLGNNPVQDIAQIHEVIGFIRQQYTDNGIGRWAVIEKSTGNFMGWAGLKCVKEALYDLPYYYDIGYRLIPSYWGKGFATEVAIASLHYGFEKMHLTEIYGAADVNNVASNKILSKIGLAFTDVFDYEGITCNRYKITLSDWAKNR